MTQFQLPYGSARIISVGGGDSEILKEPESQPDHSFLSEQLLTRHGGPFGGEQRELALKS